MDQRPLLEKTDFDVIVVGTGLTESIVSAACSRIKKKVLNFDKNEFYGSQTSTFQIQEFEKENITGTTVLKVVDSSSEEDKKFVKRHHYFDLQTKFIFCASKTVDLLVTSGIGKYMEFRGLTAVVILHDGKFKKVPVTKGEIFSSDLLDLKEKRFLMKFIKKILQENEATSKEEETMDFREFLKKQKLSKKLQDFIIYGITFCDVENPSMTVEEGKKKIKFWMDSHGRFGNSCFIYPLYGISEIPQSFSRASAVFGGTYILGRTVAEIASKKNEENKTLDFVKCTRGQKLTAKHLVVNNYFTLSKEERNDEEKVFLYRAVAVTDFPIVPPSNFKEESKKASFYRNYGAIYAILPPNTFQNQEFVISITQMDYSSKMGQKGNYILSFQTQLQKENDEVGVNILQKCIKRFVKDVIEKEKKEKETKKEAEKELTSENKTKIENEENNLKENKESEEITEVQKKLHYEVYYKRILRKENSKEFKNFENIHVCKDVNAGIGISESIEEAKTIFNKMFPGEEFIEKLPTQDQNQDTTAKVLGIDEEKLKEQVKKELEDKKTKEIIKEIVSEIISKIEKKE